MADGLHSSADSAAKFDDEPRPADAASLAKLATGALELAIVVPTFNEAENIDAMVAGLQRSLLGHVYEIIVVDDNSPDGTADRVREIAKSDVKVRCIERIGRRGLSSAVIEGGLATAAPIIAVIDGDRQHDDTLLPAMLETLRARDLEVVIGSRYLDQGGLGNWDAERVRASKWATVITRRLTGITLSDPMSGFFMIRADVFRGLAKNLSGIGFKILLDLFLTAPKPLRFAELPYQFRSRAVGTSKMEARVVLEFFDLLIDRLVGHAVPTKFVMFALVGSLGVVVHLAVFVILFKQLHVDFQFAQTVATLVAMTSNFTLNNVLTYYDRRLSGWGWLKGWASFALASSVGIFANVGIATYLFTAQGSPWLLSAVAGVLIGVVWNYAVTSVFTWGRRTTKA